MNASSQPAPLANEDNNSSPECDVLPDTIAYYSLDDKPPRYRMREISSLRCPTMRNALTSNVFQRQYANCNARIQSLHKKVAVLHQHIAQLKEWVYLFSENLEAPVRFHGSSTYEQIVKEARQSKRDIIRGTCALLLKFHDELDTTNMMLKQEEHERTLMRESYALASQADCLLLQAACSPLVYATDQDANASATSFKDIEEVNSKLQEESQNA